MLALLLTLRPDAPARGQELFRQHLRTHSGRTHASGPSGRKTKTNQTIPKQGWRQNHTPYKRWGPTRSWQVLSAAAEALGAVPADDEESAFRLLVALGTLAHGDRALAALCADLGLAAQAQRFAGRGAGSKAAQAAAEVLQLLAPQA